MPPPAGGTTSVQVAVRIRPTTSQDTVTIPARFQRTVIQATSPTSVQVDATQSAPVPAAVNGIPASSAGPTKKQSFTFDQVHQPTTSQHAMFQTTAEPLISRFLQGFNCTILAYGQTSSGKTYTMTGIDLDADPSDPQNGMGIIPRAVSKIFQRARETKDERAGAWTFSVKGSFIEIYNEDLIDLLGDENAKREVLIREDKDGNIIWGGLREVSVRNVAEVMSLLLQGTAIRRTNETDMNAQSSRSHAIFSLTLTQKKYTGSGPPPRSSSPIGRPPSRLARPGSLYNSGGQTPVSSPTSGRPPTPSFHSAMGRGGGLRPGSALGGRISPAPGVGRDDDDVGEWVTIVSKFHFVDLAGSERLKRTGGAGERIKEGISINSGLLALGNVISALGDPARVKSHTASHVPYRDSKLTRLLQDSLGGNAHTLMIACVSPAEWNVGETVNTLKYANRARNIRNRAVVNEKEDGWDDIEWLQNMVTRLRKELKNIKEGSAPASSPGGSINVEPELDNTSRMVMQQFVELQSQHNDLRQQFTQRTEELTRLRRDLGERQRASGGTIAGTAKYEEIVGPVIEEYEKTIAAMEAELSLNRVALRHTNDMVTEKEEELAVVKERHTATESYLEELRARVAKLTDRESSTEAYIRDLEEKVKAYDEKNVSSTSSVFELKREIQQYRENESRSAQYISDVEQRLSRSDENILTLREQVQRLEYEVEERVQSAELLQQRLNELTADSQGWRSDLEEREARLRELEKQLEVAEETKRLAGEELDRLGNVAGGVARARRSLEADMATAEKAALPSDSDSDVNVKEQLATLQQTHQATLADLDVVTNKYRDALREISDLAAQIQDAKLQSAIGSEASEEAHEASVPKIPRRRMTAGGGSLRSPRSDAGHGQVNGSGRRPFFRQAASTESLHARSLSQSPSLSQELSSVRSHRPSSSGVSRPESLGSSSLLAPPLPRPNLSVQLPDSAGGGGERSVASLEKEIMRLQEVLKDREAEISSLEQNLQEKASTSSSTQQPAANGISSPSKNVASDVEDVDKDIDIDKVKNLSPKTLKQFKDLRRISRRMSLQISGPVTADSIVDTSDTLDRLNELMLSMAQKESQHRDIVDGLNAELVQIRRQHDELSALSRDQALNMSTELEALRKEHVQTASELDELRLRDAQISAELEEQKVANANITSAIEELRAREVTLLNELKSAEEAYAREIKRLLAEHEQAVRDKEAKFDVFVGEAKSAHEAAIQELRAEIADGAALLARTRAEHEDAFARLRADHVLELERRSREVEEFLGQSQSDQAESLAKLQAEHSRALRREIENANARLQNVLEEHAAVLEKERSQHAEMIRQRDEDAASTLERLREEHARVLRAAELARETAIAESRASHAAAIKSLREEHATFIDLKEQTYKEVIDKGFQERELLREDMEQKHTEALEDLHADHTAALSRLEEEKAADISRLMDALEKSRDEHSAALSQHSRDLEAAVQNAGEQHYTVVQEMELKHQNALDSVKAQHETVLAQALSTHTEERAVAMESLTEATAKLKEEHLVALKEADEVLIAAEEQHRGILEETHRRSEAILAKANEKHEKVLAELRQAHEQDRETLLKDHELLVQEVAAYKSAMDEYLVDREHARERHEEEIVQRDINITSLREDLESEREQHAKLAESVEALKEELEVTRSRTSELVEEVSKRETLANDLDRHRSLLGEVQNNLQKARDERDSLAAEKMRQEEILRQLQAQLEAQSSATKSSDVLSSPVRPTLERSAISRLNGIPPAKAPPLSPPPLGPPPPTPVSLPRLPSDAGPSRSSATVSTSSRASHTDSPAISTPATSLSSAPPAINGHPPVETKASALIEEQTRQIEEQETMIKTLTKQLTHCEGDLQAHMDLVSTLQTQLNDSDRNLRKSRLQATEISKDRDRLSGQVDTLRNDLQEAKREVVTVRRSIVEEKQSLEHRLDEERKAKERARAQLDSRMEEIQKRKSKFVCM